MSVLEDYKDKISNQWLGLTSNLRKKILGSNNENIDLLVDSFYKLEAPQRNAAMVGGFRRLKPQFLEAWQQSARGHISKKSLMNMG